MDIYLPIGKQFKTEVFQQESDKEPAFHTDDKRKAQIICLYMVEKPVIFDEPGETEYAIVAHNNDVLAITKRKLFAHSFRSPFKVRTVKWI